MPVQITQLSLHELQTYALKYFPEDFNSLPKLEAMKFETFSNFGYNEKFEPVRLQIGYYDDKKYDDKRIFAYMSKTGVIYYDRGGDSLPLLVTFDSLKYATDKMEIFEPFRTVARRRDPRSHKCGSVNSKCSTILQYYFALQGVTTMVRNRYLLTSFELVCILVANSKRVSEFVILNTTPSGFARTMRRYESMTRSDMRISPHDPSMIHREIEHREEESECARRADAGIDAVSALPLSSPTEPSSLMRSPLPETDSHSSSSSEVLPKSMDAGRKRKCTDSPNDQNVSEERRLTHLDLLKTLARDRQAKANRIAHDMSLLDDKQKSSEAQSTELRETIARLTSEIEQLRSRQKDIDDVQAQHALEMAQIKEQHLTHLDSLRHDHKTSTDMLRHQFEREKAKAQSLTAEMTHHQRARNDDKANFEAYKTQAELRASKAKDLYSLHKATITLFCEGEDTEEQQVEAMKAFEEEFGELGVDIEISEG